MCQAFEGEYNAMRKSEMAASTRGFATAYFGGTKDQKQSWENEEWNSGFRSFEARVLPYSVECDIQGWHLLTDFYAEIGTVRRQFESTGKLPAAIEEKLSWRKA